MRTVEFNITEHENGLDVGTALKRFGVSRRLTVKLKRTENGITLNGEHIRTTDRVKSGDVLAIALSDGTPPEANFMRSVPVAYEDDDAVIFNKPVNMPVHPSHKHRSDTLGNYFGAIYPNLTFRPINRLDKDTSGLCAVAKNAYAAARLGGGIEKVYYAVVCGVIESDGIIDAPIGRAEESVIKREVRSDGQRAVTKYTIIKTTEKYTLVRVHLETGRTHQIRVHFAYIGHPLAGDDFYGGDTSDISCQALHCKEMSFISPSSGKMIRVEAPLREDIVRLMEGDSSSAERL